MKTGIWLLFSLHSLIVLGQQNDRLQGQLRDSISGLPVTGATISLKSAAGNSRAYFLLSGKKGDFSFSAQADGRYLLSVSCRGYLDKRVFITVINGKNDLRPADLRLSPVYQEMDAVVLRSAYAVKIKGDTVQYLLDSAAVRPGASLDEALQKLPGIEIQKDGTIRAMGETIQKLYVDGKEFFGNSPGTAARTLLAEMADQVQVVDERSEQARFTGIDDGQRARVLYVRLKKDRKKGDFGKETISAGTHQRYDTRLTWNHFSAQQKLALFTAGSNTNKADYQFSAPASSAFGNGGQEWTGAVPAPGGIYSSRSAGISYSMADRQRLSLSSHYQYSESSNRLQQYSNKRYLFPDDSFTVTCSALQASQRSRHHTLNLRAEYTLDSLQSLLFTGHADYQQSIREQQDSSQTTAEGMQSFVAVKSNAEKADRNRPVGFGTELMYRRRFLRPGQTLVISWKLNQSLAEAANYRQSLATLFNNRGIPLAVIHPDQVSSISNNARGQQLNAAYTFPAGRGRILEWHATYTTGLQAAETITNRYNPLSGWYDERDWNQSSDMNFSQQVFKTGANFRIHKKRMSFQSGAALQWTGTRAVTHLPLTGKDSIIRQQYFNFFPSASFQLTSRNGSQLRVYYRGRTQMPTAAQLQEVTDNSNPLLLRQGNPALKQEFTSNLEIFFNQYRQRTGIFFSAGLQLASTAGKIVNQVDSLPAAVLRMRPVNMPGNYSGSAVLQCNVPLKKGKAPSLSFATMAFLNRERGIVLQQKNRVSLLALNQLVKFNWSVSAFAISLGANGVLQAQYNSLPVTRITRSFQLSWIADIRYRFGQSWFMASSLQQTRYSGLSENFNQRISLWNLSLAKQLLKNQAAEIKLTAFDLLNQDKGIARIAGSHYTEDTRSSVVPRFLLLTLSYTFNRAGQAAKKDSAVPVNLPPGMLRFSN